MGANANARSNFNVKSTTIAVNTALAAGADLGELGVWVAPCGCKVHRITVLPQVSSVGVDGSNTSVWTVRNGVAGSTIGLLTRTSNFAANTPVSLTITESAAELTQGTVVTLQVTNGATADLDGITYLCIDYSSDGLVAA